MVMSAVPAQRRAERGPHSSRAIVLGAGVAGRALARDLEDAPEFGLCPIGFLDDQPSDVGGLPLPVLGCLDDLRTVVVEHDVQVVVVAIPLLARAKFRAVVEAAASVGANVRYLPSFTAALERDIVGSDVRNLDVRRLIGRTEMHGVSAAARAGVHGRRVLVTGAGGSIGSELCRQVKGFGPSHLFMLDHDESNLHRLQLDLSGQALLDTDDLIVADIRDRARIEQVFGDLRPDVVFHAAAHKHLPLLERNPCEGVKSNVRGTQVVLNAATRHGAQRFILISTDKAADPTSVLGATKRLAELVVQDAAHDRIDVAAVRFGNVLGSRGSLLTVLAEQMRRGNPVTVTHPDVTRFFMTIEEAVGLVLEAAHMAGGGDVFVLDMGEPVRIVDLVRGFAQQVSAPDFEIHYTGLRPGEKLNESLFSEQESCVPTVHPRIYKTVHRPVRIDFQQQLTELYAASATNDASVVKDALASMLPNYAPPSELVPVVAAPYPDDY